MKTDYHNTKLEPNAKYYCWENSDYEIRILSRSASTAVCQGLLKTREPIRQDEQGNEYVQFRTDFGCKQTYYAFAKC